MRFIWEPPDLDEAVLLAAEGFRRPVTDALIGDVQAHLRSSEFSLCMRENGRLVAYMLFTIPTSDVLYISGTLVTESMRGKGLKTEGTVIAFARYRALRWLAGRTQSSVVWASAARISSELYPNRDCGGSPSTTCAHRLYPLMTKLRMNSPVHHGFYGGQLYGEKPVHRLGAQPLFGDQLVEHGPGVGVELLRLLAHHRVV